MEKTRLILVGGFLGAGKTTLLWEAARRLMGERKRVGLITNDQAPELVDTALLSHSKVKVSEVSGSCFCCNFNGFVDAVKEVKTEAKVDILIAEPVGSCTDLSATILQPLKENMKRELTVSPLSVLVDPVKLLSILDGGNGGLHPSAAYIFRKQLEEGDIILINKTDLLDIEDLQKLIERTKINFPDADVMTVSAGTGHGVEKWLNEVMRREDAGKRLTVVDYDVYAEGEAVLGWLNCTLKLTGKDIDWDHYAKGLLEGLSAEFDSKSASVGHVKMMLESGSDFLVGNLTGAKDTISFRGKCGRSDEAKLMLNARVEMNPAALENLVRDRLKKANSGISMKILAWRCLSPGRPKPTFRYDRVVPVINL